MTAPIDTEQLTWYERTMVGLSFYFIHHGRVKMQQKTPDLEHDIYTGAT